jgi:two-component system, sensor histidine kinase and response regulator
VRHSLVSTKQGNLAITQQAMEGFRSHQQRVYRGADRLFGGLMIVQWVAAVATAGWVSPWFWGVAWQGSHLLVWVAFLLGGLITLVPVVLVQLRPGQAVTRHTVAICQMLMSGLLIYLTGGRIETHFHVFGSLAFLAFYRDWRVLIPATIVTGLDHWIRGALWPESIFGVASVHHYRWLEHVAWVVFEDIFLVLACLRSTREMQSLARRQARQKAVNQRIERLVAEKTADLRASEERFRSLSAAAPMGIFHMDAQKLNVYSNAHWHRLSGLSFEETLGHGWQQAIHPDDLKTLLSRRKFDANGIEHIEEFRVVDKQGKVHWVHSCTAPLWGENGEQLGYVGTLMDITERKRVEVERTRVFSLSRDLIAIAGFDGYLKYMNPSWQRELGFPPAELLSQPVLNFVHPEDLAATEAVAQRLIAEENTQDYENRMCCQDGTYRWFLWSATPVAAEKLCYLVGKDITERKLVEEALREREERFRNIIEEITDDYWEVDLAGNFTFFNSQMMKSNRRTREELMGANYREFMDEPTAKMVKAAFHQIYQTGEPLRGLLFEMKWADGSHWVNESSVSLIRGHDGRPIGFRGLSRDVTERRRSENMLTAEQGILETIATGTSLDEILDLICRLAEEQSSGMLCSILLA